MKRLVLCLTLLLLSVGCALKHPDSTPVTPYEKVILANASLAQVNNSVARGVIQLEGVNPGVLSNGSIEKILRVQASIADADNRLTLILDQGPTVAGGQAAQIQALIATITQQIDLGIQDGALGVKNPATQQSFTADLQAIKGFADQLATTLKIAGVLK